MDIGSIDDSKTHIYEVDKCLKVRYGNVPTRTERDVKWIEQTCQGPVSRWLGKYIYRMTTKMLSQNPYELLMLDNEFEKYNAVTEIDDYITDFIEVMYNRVTDHPDYEIYMSRVDNKLKSYQVISQMQDPPVYEDIDEYLLDTRHDWSLHIDDLDMNTMTRRLRNLMNTIKSMSPYHLPSEIAVDSLGQSMEELSIS